MKKLTRQSVENMVRTERLKMTPQRHAIVEYLQSATHHPSAEDVLKAVNGRFPMTSRATVYNTLNWLRDAGLIQEVFEGGVVHFDPNTSQHHHFVCRICGAVEDIDGDTISPLPQCTLSGKQTIETVHVTLRGVCGQCAKKIP